MARFLCLREDVSGNISRICFLCLRNMHNLPTWWHNEYIWLGHCSHLAPRIDRRCICRIVRRRDLHRNWRLGRVGFQSESLRCYILHSLGSCTRKSNILLTSCSSLHHIDKHRLIGRYISSCRLLLCTCKYLDWSWGNHLRIPYTSLMICTWHTRWLLNYKNCIFLRLSSILPRMLYILFVCRLHLNILW